MSISNYGELKTAAARFVSLAGFADYTSSVPDFVILAEANIRRDVRVLDMLKTQAGNLVSGAFALPPRFIGVRSLTIDPYGPIDYVDPSEMAQLSTRTYPAGYSIGATEIDVAGAGTDPYVMTYWQSYAPLSTDSDTNWLLTNAPDVYLFATLANGADFMKDDAALTKYAERYRQAVEGVNAQARAQLFGKPARVRARVVA